jgi:uncharacterized iron-regulated membrane protein
MKQLEEMSTEELLLEAQSKNLDNMFSRLEQKQPAELPDWVAAVDENGLSRGYEESYENFQQRL